MISKTSISERQALAYHSGNLPDLINIKSIRLVTQCMTRSISEFIQKTSTDKERYRIHRIWEVKFIITIIILWIQSIIIMMMITVDLSRACSWCCFRSCPSPPTLKWWVVKIHNTFFPLHFIDSSQRDNNRSIFPWEIDQALGIYWIRTLLYLLLHWVARGTRGLIDRLPAFGCTPQD